MPAPATVDELLALLCQSELANRETLTRYLNELRARSELPTSPQQLAERLVQDALVTRFQAKQLLQGRWRRFSLGKYRVLDQLGSGGMAKVFLGADPSGQPVAIKVLPTSQIRSPSALERFQREARAGTALNHPHIIRTHDLGQEDHLHFLVMEYLEGSDLHDLVARHGPLTPLRAAHYLRQAAEGLEHIHGAGLVHRDIKPSNLFLTRNGVVKILDLGLARFHADDSDNLTQKFDERVLGTADYFAPEQSVDSHTVDIRADIYSLGCTGYFLLTGRAPFKDATPVQKLLCHQLREPPPISQFRPDVPNGLTAILSRMMAKVVGSRYQTPAAVVAALLPWTQEAIPPPADSEMTQRLSRASQAIAAAAQADEPAVPAVPLPPKRHRVPRRLVGAAVLGVTFLVALGWWALSGTGKSAFPHLGSTPAGKAPATPGLTQPAPVGLLRGSAGTASSPVDLSQVGAADWVHWGTGAVQESLRKKTTLPWIKDWTMIGRGQVKTYGDNPTRFTWTDGTQPAPPGGDAHGVFVEGASNGFEVLVPADTTPRTVKVYVGVFRGQTRFEARLSDDSAPGWTDDSLLNKDGPSNALYTIHFRARSANQQLILRHTLLNTFNRLGNVTLQAAALMP